MSFDAGAATSTLGLNVAPFRQGMLEATAIAQTFPPVVTAFLANPLLGVAALAATVGQAIATGLSSAIGTGLQLAGDMEAATISMEVLLGSAGRAKSMMVDLTKFAAATPFELPGIVATARQFLGFGMAADKVLPSLKALGDVAAIADKPLQEVGLIYAQVMSKTKLQTEELLQFAERGVPLRRELEKMTGLKGTGFDAEVTKGKISFDMVEEAFRRMTSGTGAFADGAAKSSLGIKGLLSTLADARGSLNRGFGSGFAEGLNFKGVVTDATAILGNLEGVATSFGQRLGGALRPVVEEVVGWIRDHPQEAAAKAQAAADAIVAAVGAVTRAVQQVLPIAGAILNNIKEIGLGAAGISAVRVVTNLASSYFTLAAGIGAANAAQAAGGGPGGLGGAAAAAGGVGGAARGGLLRGLGGRLGLGAGAGLGVGGLAYGLTGDVGLSGGIGAGVGLGVTVGSFFGPLGLLIGALVGGAGGALIGSGTPLVDTKLGNSRTERTVTIKVGPDTDAASLARQIGNKSMSELRRWLEEQQASGEFRSLTAEGL
ncbi:tape measure protein [Humisphaera borealis]|uniref:Tape measure protein N-terminal domain-containing protein n=1 Tax=Humisphaera borealis TaxID=2807512 RepID=A0A7M2WZQ4_9BACT|nr:tape measure protein [Humisphaera borealis]QOV90883.1 hypothetical protein IPV69_05855 [Humisphaera borealis]